MIANGKGTPTKERSENMSLTRKMLSAMEIEPEKVGQIIDGHTETVNALQGEIDKAKAEAEKYRTEAEKVPALEKELDAAKKEAETAKNSGEKYESLKKEFEEYRAEQEKNAADAKKREVFTSLLKDMNMSENGIAMVLKWQGVDDVEVDGDGKITNAKELRKAVKDDWGDYIAKEETTGAETAEPPVNTGGNSTMTREEIFKIADPIKRQQAIADNANLFGL